MNKNRESKHKRNIYLNIGSPNKSYCAWNLDTINEISENLEKKCSIATLSKKSCSECKYARENPKEETPKSILQDHNISTRDIYERFGGVSINYFQLQLIVKERKIRSHGAYARAVKDRKRRRERGEEIGPHGPEEKR